MKRVEIQETNLSFVKALSHRDYTDMIVIHHTGCNDIDASAEQIHGWHLNNPGWAGIGYHFVIRKDGTIERGRPEWAIGSHAYGENSHTLGIHLSGDFMEARPTTDQIERCAALIADLCEDYDIPTDRDHVVGHGELMPTSCPGTHLQALLNDGTLTGKANYYRYGPPPESSTAEANWQKDMEQIKKELSNEETIWNFLKGKGLPDFAAAGVMGNLFAESGLSPVNLENYYEGLLGMDDRQYTNAVDDGSYDNFVHDSAGYGLAQWTYYSRKQGLLDAARAAGKSIGDIGVQLDFLWKEMQSYRDTMESLEEADSVADACRAFMLEFERPADQSTEAQERRISYAEGYYDRLAGSNFSQEDQQQEEAITTMRYNKLTDMPEWAKPTVKKMIDKGFLGGSGAKDGDGNPIELDLSLDMVRTFVVLDRAGNFG